MAASWLSSTFTRMTNPSPPSQSPQPTAATATTTATSATANAATNGQRKTPSLAFWKKSKVPGSIKASRASTSAAPTPVTATPATVSQANNGASASPQPASTVPSSSPHSTSVSPFPYSSHHMHTISGGMPMPKPQSSAYVAGAGKSKHDEEDVEADAISTDDRSQFSYQNSSLANYPSATSASFPAPSAIVTSNSSSSSSSSSSTNTASAANNRYVFQSDNDSTSSSFYIEHYQQRTQGNRPLQSTVSAQMDPELNANNSDVIPDESAAIPTLTTATAQIHLQPQPLTTGSAKSPLTSAQANSPSPTILSPVATTAAPETSAYYNTSLYYNTHSPLMVRTSSGSTAGLNPLTTPPSHIFTEDTQSNTQATTPKPVPLPSPSPLPVSASFSASSSPAAVSASSPVTASSMSIPATLAGSASVSKERNIKSENFIKLMNADNTDLEGLRRLSWHGIPSNIRADAWRLLLGYLPANKARRQPTLEKRRDEYRTYLRQYYYVEEQNRSEAEHDIIRQIRQDVKRTCSNLPFFQSAAIQASLERVLYLFAIRHPASGYVQGMNDLASAFYILFTLNTLHLDSQPVNDQLLHSLIQYLPQLASQSPPSSCAPASSSSSSSSSTSSSFASSAVFSGDNLSHQMPTDSLIAIEADSFWCLSKLLDGIQDHYTFAQPGIQRMVFRLKELVGRIDSGLTRHLECHNVQFIHFGFRWSNCLLMRELSLPLILRLWDCYLSEDHGNGFKHFHVYVCAAFLMKWSEKLKEMDFQDLVLFLQKLPTEKWEEKDVETLLAQAFIYKSWFHASPNHLQ